jgi:hypothetical protein
MGFQGGLRPSLISSPLSTMVMLVGLEKANITHRKE